MGITHDTLTNLLFEHLASEGYDVYAEIHVKIPPYIITKPKLHPNGTLSMQLQHKNKIRMDIVAVSGSIIRGYEVKIRIEDFCNSRTWDNVKNALNSKYFNEVYVVVPTYIIDRVLNSYRKLFEDHGLGLIELSPNKPIKNRINVRIKAKSCRKTKQLKLKRNEAWLKHVLGIKYREGGFKVYLGVPIPKPLSRIGYEKVYSIKSVLNEIDLLLVKGNYCNGEAIGIEVKYNIKGLTEKELEQLKEYVESGVLTKLYLAVNKDSNTQELIQQIKNIGKVGLLIIELNSNLRGVEVIEGLKAHNLTKQICAFSFVNPSRNSMELCDFIRYEGCLRIKGIKSEDEVKELLLKKYQELRACTNKYSFIYLGRGKGGYVYPRLIKL